MDSSFCSRLPKLELHAHLNGSISQNTLEELYKDHCQQGGTEIEGWKSFTLCKDYYSLEEFFDLFKIIYAITSTPKAIQKATERVIEDFSKDNVIYLELRSTLRKNSKMTKKDFLESLIKGVLSCKNRFSDIKVKLLVSISRSEVMEEAEESVKLAIEYFKKHPDIIVGIDVSGNPKERNFCDYLKIFENARSVGLKFTVHCGEVKGDKEVKDILDFHPDRLGHCTCIHESFEGSDKNWKELLVKKIPVELCLTSNIKCKTVLSYEKHHFSLLYKAKHPIALATDDKGVFNTTLTQEYSIVQKTFNLTNEDLWNLSYNTINYIFSSENEKEALRTILKEWQKKNFVAYVALVRSERLLLPQEVLRTFVSGFKVLQLLETIFCSTLDPTDDTALHSYKLKKIFIKKIHNVAFNSAN